jgi:hypothetical protein
VGVSVNFSSKVNQVSLTTEEDRFICNLSTLGSFTMKSIYGYMMNGQIVFSDEIYLENESTF